MTQMQKSCCVQVLVDNPAELEKIRDRESDITKERIQKVLEAGANVVLTTKGIDDMSLKYFVEAGVIACRRVPKEDLRYALCYCQPAYKFARSNAQIGLLGNFSMKSDKLYTLARGCWSAHSC